MLAIAPKCATCGGPRIRKPNSHTWVIAHGDQCHSCQAAIRNQAHWAKFQAEGKGQGEEGKHAQFRNPYDDPDFKTDMNLGARLALKNRFDELIRRVDLDRASDPATANRDRLHALREANGVFANDQGHEKEEE